MDFYSDSYFYFRFGGYYLIPLYPSLLLFTFGYYCYCYYYYYALLLELIYYYNCYYYYYCYNYLASASKKSFNQGCFLISEIGNLYFGSFFSNFRTKSFASKGKSLGNLIFNFMIFFSKRLYYYFGSIFLAVGVNGAYPVKNS